MSELVKRLASGVVMAAVAITAIFAGGDVYLGLLIAAAAILLFEIWQLIAKIEKSGPLRFTYMALAVGYIGLAVLGLWHVRTQTAPALFWTAQLFGIVWATDIGAYVVGRAVGGPKIAPGISPSKTWAGLAGGTCAAMLTIWLMSIWYFQGDWRAIAYNFPLVPLLGMPMALLAQSGDFAESFLKRRAGVKDSGTLIPGHGGLFDRVDGLLPVAIVFQAWVTALVT